MKLVHDEEERKAFVKSCQTFKAYNDVKEYEEDVAACLVYSPWRYSEERAKERVKRENRYVQKAFKEKMPADDCSIEIGYSCG